jgi:hypothetical protein
MVPAGLNGAGAQPDTELKSGAQGGRNGNRACDLMHSVTKYKLTCSRAVTTSEART